MDQGKIKGFKQGLLDFKCKKIVPEANKPCDSSLGSDKLLKDIGEKNSEAQIAALTPQKKNEPSRAEYKEETVDLPEKYKIISEFFDRMLCSLRLLTMGKKLPTFQNISTQVEILAKRQFSHRHLAQIKYIVPEVIQIDKILIHDLKTLCMKPDMKVTLRRDVMESSQEQSSFVTLRQVFASRLLNFSNMQPEGCDIPEAILPEPFSLTCQSDISEALPVASPTESQPSFVETGPLLDSFHLRPSFSQRFCEKSIVAETEKTPLLASPVAVLSVKSDPAPIEEMDNQITEESSDLVSNSTIVNAPVHTINHDPSPSFSSCESPVVKLPLVDKSLTVDTPAQLAQKRSMPSCDNKPKAAGSQKRITSLAKRSLHFSISEGDESDSNSDISELEYKVGRKAMPQTAGPKGISKEESVFATSALLLKGQKSNCRTVKDLRMSQAGVIDSLPGLIPVICHIFKCASRSVITKEELVHKIIMNNFDIVDRKEVEEQIELLEELAPDWFSRKITPSGDLLCSIKAVADLDSVRARLITMDKTV